MPDDTWHHHTAARSQLNKWQAALAVALNNRQRDQFEDGLMGVGVRLLAGVAPGITTWGHHFPFHAVFLASENDNRFHGIPDGWQLEWDNL